MSIGNDADPGMPPADVDVGGPVSELALGDYHTCGILPGPWGGQVRCWGSGDNGRLGTGDTTAVGDDDTPGMPPTSVDLGGGRMAFAIAAGDRHTCALVSSEGQDGVAVKCWGSGTSGKLGYGTEDDIGEVPQDMPPADVSMAGDPFDNWPIDIAAGSGHTCVLFVDGTVGCWGYGIKGQLGYEDDENIGDDELPSTAGGVEVF